MLAIISPAKTLDYTSTYEVPNTTIPVFATEAQYLIKKLATYTAKRIAKLMDVSADIAALNYQRFQEFEAEYIEGENARPAIFAFKGDVYLGLDAYSLNKAQLATAQNQVAILSGLYGLLKPLDLMQPYRLEMGTALKVTAAKNNLYKYWGTKLNKEIENRIEKLEGEQVLINLASNEYAKAAQLGKLKFPVIDIEFKERRPNGDFKVISFNAKKARGQMVRFMLENKITESEGLKSFAVDGYHFNEDFSEQNKWVFTREM